MLQNNDTLNSNYRETSTPEEEIELEKFDYKSDPFQFVRNFEKKYKDCDSKFIKFGEYLSGDIFIF